MDGGGEEIDTDERQIALGFLRLLLQRRHPALGVELRDTEGGGVGYLGQQDLRIGPVRAELLHQTGDPADDEVVAEVHDEVVVPQEVTGDQHRVGEAERLVLRDVGDLDAEPGTVADGLADLRGGVAHDDADLGDPRFRDGFQPVEQHGLVRHGHQLLGRGVRDGPQAGTGPSG